MMDDPSYRDWKLNIHSNIIIGKLDTEHSISTNCSLLQNITISSSKDSVTLSWTPQSPNLISYYEIAYSYVKPCVANIPSGVERFSGSQPQYTLSGLEEYSTYRLTHYIIHSVQSQDDGYCTYDVNTIAAGIIKYCD